MSAILVPAELLRDAESITGQPSFGVELVNSSGVVTHYGTNWEGCQADICDALRGVGCAVYETWLQALQESGLSVKTNEAGLL